MIVPNDGAFQNRLALGTELIAAYAFYLVYREESVSNRVAKATNELIRIHGRSNFLEVLCNPLIVEVSIDWMVRR